MSSSDIPATVDRDSSSDFALLEYEEKIGLSSGVSSRAMIRLLMTQ